MKCLNRMLQAKAVAKDSPELETELGKCAGCC